MSDSHLLDCRGLFCPVPILRTSQEIRRMEEGEVLELLADDPGVPEDLAAWCKGAGHELLALEREGSLIRGRVRKRGRER